MTSIRNDRGQATVLTVIFLVALLGAVALVLDVGSWFREQRDTQSTADAAALAAAQALPDSTGEANALANEYLAKNGGGTANVKFTSGPVANDTVTVEVAREAPGVFSKLFGIESVTVDARATARSGGMDAARWVAPIVVNLKHPKLQCGGSQTKPTPCFGDATEIELEHLHKPGSGNAAGAFGLINLDVDDNGSVGGSTLGDWIQNGFDGYMDLGSYTSVPSAKFNDSHVKGALAARIAGDNELLFPIYKTISGSGSNAVYDVVGWVGFTVTKFVASGSTGKVYGSFTKVLWEGIQSDSGNNLNFGTNTVELVE
jgi:secretion/DNA translocation related TadE-like protein